MRNQVRAEEQSIQGEILGAGSGVGRPTFQVKLFWSWLYFPLFPPRHVIKVWGIMLVVLWEVKMNQL